MTDYLSDEEKCAEEDNYSYMSYDRGPDETDDDYEERMEDLDGLFND